MKKQIRTTGAFGPKERRAIVEEYLNGSKSRAAVWRKHTGQQHEKGQLLRWIKQLGYMDNVVNEDIVTFDPMPKEKKKEESPEELKARIKELERQLEDSQIKEEAYRRMIDIAEKELKISIRKKSNT